MNLARANISGATYMQVFGLVQLLDCRPIAFYALIGAD